MYILILKIKKNNFTSHKSISVYVIWHLCICMYCTHDVHYANYFTSYLYKPIYRYLYAHYSLTSYSKVFFILIKRLLQKLQNTHF